MTSDRRFGVIGETGIKMPVRVATTANITLSGLQTVDGVALAQDDRVLVKNQTSSINNGVYDVDTGAWTRSADFDGPYDVVKGTLVTVTDGTANIKTVWRLTTENTVTIGSSALTFEQAVFSDASTVSFIQSGTGAASMTIQNAVRLIASVTQFGAVGDNATDDYAAVQAAIDAVALAGGGLIYCERGKTYKLTVAPIIKDKVSVDLQGSTWRLTLNGGVVSDYGVRLRNYARISNGTVNVVSSGAPGSQAAAHSPIVIGPMYSDGGTVASPSADEGVTGWAVTNMRLSTDRDGKVGIQIMGGANNGIIDQVEIPDSAVMGGGIHADWGYLGTFSAANIAAGRTAFDAGTMYTTHPNNIRITNIKIGSLSRGLATVPPTEATGVSGIRLSGCHNILVENVTSAGLTWAGCFVTAGDAGYEFAPAAIKKYALRGLKFRNILHKNMNNGWGWLSDTYADDVQAALDAATYANNYLATISETDMVVEELRSVSNAGANVNEGIYVRFQKGGTLIDCQSTGHKHGALIGQRADHTTLERGIYNANRLQGILVDNATNPPEDTVIRGARCYANDTSGGTSAGIKCDSATRPKIVECQLGDKNIGTAGFGFTEATQDYGIQLTASTTNATIKNNHVYAVAAAGTSYVMAGSKDYGALREFSGNTQETGIANKYAGVDMIPFAYQVFPDNSIRRRLAGSSASLTGSVTPTAGTWVNGDTIYYSNPAAASFIGVVCTTGGSPGTWKTFGPTSA